MNMSEVVTRIKLKLGLTEISTPFEDINKTITEIIQTITLPVFSIYQPHANADVQIDVNRLERIDRGPEYEEFILPQFPHKLLYIYEVKYAETYLANALGASSADFPLISSGVISSYCLSNAMAQITRELIPTMTFDFIKPATLKLYNRYYQSRLSFNMGFEHDKSLSTIPETCRESFMKLAILDVKSNLYPSLKYYNEIESAYGRVNLRLDGWESAEQERDELINNWDDNYHLDTDAFYFA